jgi:glycosyltransferase involved in cell wall biosynthesis
VANLRICFIADYRSSISRSWIGYFENHPGYEVSVITSRRQPVPGRRRERRFQPRFLHSLSPGQLSVLSRILSRGIRILVLVRGVHLLIGSRRVRGEIERFNPDLVHAMRIPFEGILAARASTERPLVVSVWGNDFSLWADASRVVRAATRATLRRTTSLQADCHVDIRRAQELGLRRGAETLVVPCSGGISDTFLRAGRDRLRRLERGPVIVNPRGVRSYVRNDVFFRAIPQILEAFPDAYFYCLGMSRSWVMHSFVEVLGIQDHVSLLPTITQDEVADLYRRSDIVVSPTEHDGTPNTVLEAMAAGVIPVVGDLPSLREWIEHLKNGVLCDPRDPASISAGVRSAISVIDLEEARRRNLALVEERAMFGKSMRQVEAFYRTTLGSGR